MLKKLLLLAVGFGIAMGIAACHEENASKKEDATATSATTEPESTSSATTTTEPSKETPAQ